MPAEKLRCATAVTVDEDYVIPANSEGVILAAIAGGDYACARARVVDYDFATPWMQFFDSLQQSTATTTATGISTCMFPLSASRRSGLPLFRTRFFTFPACSGRKSSYNWPFRFAGEGCAR